MKKVTSLEPRKRKIHLPEILNGKGLTQETLIGKTQGRRFNLAYARFFPKGGPTPVSRSKLSWAVMAGSVQLPFRENKKGRPFECPPFLFPIDF
jgi:hypothetical protein